MNKHHTHHAGRWSWRRALAAALLLAVTSVVPSMVTSAGAAAGTRTVVLLHGLNRGSGSMSELATALERDGYRVRNVDYPSSTRTIAELADWLATYLDGCCAAAASAAGLDFVTHSLGGILVRELHHRHPGIRIDRVVMLSPPNRGSELVDALGTSALFRMITGPAGQQLGTGPNSVPIRLGPVDFHLGVIAGNATLNPVYSWIIPGDDDGTVAVARARVAGMQDFIVIDANHTFVMQTAEAIRQTLIFLREGRFEHP